MVTVLTEQGPVEMLAQSDPSSEELWLKPDDAERTLGWTLKPEGLCCGDICVPLPEQRAHEYTREGAVNMAAFWRRMSKPVLHSRDGEIWLLGESAAARAAVLETLEAPDFTLPDVAGQAHALSDYRGKKVLLATWASW